MTSHRILCAAFDFSLVVQATGGDDDDDDDSSCDSSTSSECSEDDDDAAACCARVPVLVCSAAILRAVAPHAVGHCALGVRELLFLVGSQQPEAREDFFGCCARSETNTNMSRFLELHNRTMHFAPALRIARCSGVSAMFGLGVALELPRLRRLVFDGEVKLITVAERAVLFEWFKYEDTEEELARWTEVELLARFDALLGRNTALEALDVEAKHDTCAVAAKKMKKMKKRARKTKKATTGDAAAPPPPPPAFTLAVVEHLMMVTHGRHPGVRRSVAAWLAQSPGRFVEDADEEAALIREILVPTLASAAASGSVDSVTLHAASALSRTLATLTDASACFETLGVYGVSEMACAVLDLVKRIQSATTSAAASSNNNNNNMAPFSATALAVRAESGSAKSSGDRDDKRPDDLLETLLCAVGNIAALLATTCGGRHFDECMNGAHDIYASIVRAPPRSSLCSQRGAPSPPRSPSPFLQALFAPLQRFADTRMPQLEQAGALYTRARGAGGDALGDADRLALASNVCAFLVHCPRLLRHPTVVQTLLLDPASLGNETESSSSSSILDSLVAVALRLVRAATGKRSFAGMTTEDAAKMLWRVVPVLAGLHRSVAVAAEPPPPPARRQALASLGSIFAEIRLLNEQVWAARTARAHCSGRSAAVKRRGGAKSSRKEAEEDDDDDEEVTTAAPPLPALIFWIYFVTCDCCPVAEESSSSSNNSIEMTEMLETADHLRSLVRGHRLLPALLTVCGEAKWLRDDNDDSDDDDDDDAGAAAMKTMHLSEENGLRWLRSVHWWLKVATGEAEARRARQRKQPQPQQQTPQKAPTTTLKKNGVASPERRAREEIDVDADTDTDVEVDPLASLEDFQAQLRRSPAFAENFDI